MVGRRKGRRGRLRVEGRITGGRREGRVSLRVCRSHSSRRCLLIYYGEGHISDRCSRNRQGCGLENPRKRPTHYCAFEFGTAAGTAAAAAVDAAAAAAASSLAT